MDLITAFTETRFRCSGANRVMTINLKASFVGYAKTPDFRVMAGKVNAVPISAALFEKGQEGKGVLV